MLCSYCSALRTASPNSSASSTQIAPLAAEVPLPLPVAKQDKLLAHRDVVRGITSEFTSKKECCVCCPPPRVPRVLAEIGVAVLCFAYCNIFLNKTSLFFLSVGSLNSSLLFCSGHMHPCLYILFFKNVLLLL